MPLGLRGTLIRIQKGTRPSDNLYDVVFDKPFIGGLALNCTAGRGYRLPGSALINISFKVKYTYDSDTLGLSILTPAKPPPLHIILLSGFCPLYSAQQ